MRDFEKISWEQFKKDVKEDKALYQTYPLPRRDSKRTAGYDIYLLEDLRLKPNEKKKIPTGIKAYFEDDEVLLLFVRSSMGFKYDLKLTNQVGVIDADCYQNKDNEGHIWISVQNTGEEEFLAPKGSAIVQGIFVKYLTTESDLSEEKERMSDY